MVFHFVGCTSSESDAIKEFIPGTYIRTAQTEFGKAYDTLVITLQNKSVNEYKIQRRWKYDRILDGKRIEPEYKITETSGLFDGEKNILQETETLEIFSFDTRNNLMFNGANKFTKIK
ncbi:MAG: hypothetical protein IM581_12155 [Chitinophagaceae bacterium]|nr:hypothetical protein [Chitinophagaceae bacterium]